MSEYHELTKPDPQAEQPLPYQYPIRSYNDVVELYNSASNDSSRLVALRDSKPFMHLYRLYSTWPGSILMALLLLLVPLANAGLLVWMAICLHHLFVEYRKHQRNLRLVPNPFQQFVEHQQLCQRLGKHHTQLQLNIKDVQGLTFNRSLNRAVMDRSTNGTVDLIIYDKTFHDGYYNLRRHQVILLWWLTMGCLLVIFSTVAYVQLITQA